jgi:hypothetical protein
MCLMANGSAWLHDSLLDAAGVRIQYERAGQRTALAAVPGETIYEATDARGAMFLSRLTDFIVAADELRMSGRIVEPIVGDTIIAGAKTYRVTANSTTQQVFRPCDSHRLRIHTREVF